MVYAADFETITDPEDCRVWAWALSEVENPDNFIYGNNIDTFMEFCASQKSSPTLYFHNLKFDGEFVLSWLFKNGFRHTEGKKRLEKGEFSTLISDMGQFYSIRICFDRAYGKIKQLTLLDSLKLLNMKVETVAKTFGLPISKLSLDYDKHRGVGHILNEEEIAYIKNDVTIMAMALQKMFEMQLAKMTIGSNALNEYKKLIGKKRFSIWFPSPSYDADIRGSYKGGFTYVNPCMRSMTLVKVLF